ncbi:MAG: DUF177 domain-containing protein [Acidobacteria bacterium]|nr:DUF177 domain-containing protein [Acidobacteriota bacterium]MXZ73127.1 DUF177 domain-containing protein [Acidobacteriota bacterium]MYD71547.1 DUF177 domain-containing protein [Acidobacteriota bacterium]MYJ02811.1 DUF177 domain-containing protein [Acidobacteriota bacterium]
MLHDARAAGKAPEVSEQFDLRDVRGQIEPLERSFPASSFAGAEGERDEYTVAAPVVLELLILKDGDRYRLSGPLRTTVERSCSRCLKPFQVPTVLDIDVRYHPQRANTGDGEHEISDDDLSIAYYRDDQIHLGDLVREQLRLASPMKPLCNDDCRGLCPVCGVNRNETTCDCVASWHDPRFDRLRTLRPTPARAALMKKA